MKRTILSLDLGTQTGWALLARDGVTLSGSQPFKPGRFEGGGMRYLRFHEWLGAMNDSAFGFGVIYFEEVRRHAGTDAAHIYGGLMATLTAWAEKRNIPYTAVPVGTIKRHWTGKGNASKEAMIAEAVRRGFRPADDNEADALALLDYARKTTLVGAPT